MTNLFVANDSGSALQVTCKDKTTGVVIDLTGKTVQLRWEDADGVLVTREMVIVNGPGGIASYKFALNELYGPTMRFEVQITDPVLQTVVTGVDLIEVGVREPLT